MSISSFSVSHPDTPYWAQQETPKQQLHNIITSTCIYNDKEAETQHPHIEKHVQESNKTMFEKPLTPSDVGKLNRLVIPKQHAEKNFPLSGDSIDKGLLLSFEDELGKSWKFRYSYWNSSQSYVLTKGWSRYVKEKRLDAGDVVFFARHRIDSDRLFIGWRRRGEAVDNAAATPQDCRVVNAYHGGGGGDINGGWSRMMVRSGQRYPNPSHYHGHGPHVPCQFDSIHAGSVVQHNQAMEATKGNSSSKILRLFGVNMECQLEENEPYTQDSSYWSSQSHSQAYHQKEQYYYSQPFNSSRHSHMDN